MVDSADLKGTTPLTELSIPHLELVLDEIFNIPPAWVAPLSARPVTVADLAQSSGLGLPAVLSRLGEIMQTALGIEVEAEALAAELAGKADDDPQRPLLVDVREPWEFAICHLPASILLTEVNFATLLPRLKAAASVVTICHHGVRSYSAAMALREQGVAARSLAGGVEAWALRVDPQLARY